MYEWFSGRRLRSFWSPIIDPGEGWWRDLHVRAHVLGGVVWALVLRFLVLAGPTAVWVDFRAHPLARIAGVAVIQLTLWEAIQRENWRPELLTPPGKPGTGYPWLSAGWDTLFAVLGAALFELVLALGHTLF